MNGPSSSQTLPCLKDAKDPKGLERAQGHSWAPGLHGREECAARVRVLVPPPQGRGCLPGGAQAARRDVSTQDAPPPPLTATSETARPHLDHWASSAASLRASSGDCCIGQHCRGAASPEPGSRPAGSRGQRRPSPRVSPSGASVRRAQDVSPPDGHGGRNAGGRRGVPLGPRPADVRRGGRAAPPGQTLGLEPPGCFFAAASVLPAVVPGRPCSAKTGEALEGRVQGGDPGPGAALDTLQSGAACVPPCKWGRRWSPPHRLSAMNVRGSFNPLPAQ